MKLLTKAIRKKLPAIKSQDGKGDQAVAYVKFFTPWGAWTWYATEGGPILDEDGKETDFEFFGLVDGFEAEYGYWRLSDLKSVSGPGGLGIERDLYWKPKSIGQIKAGHQQLKSPVENVEGLPAASYG